MVACFLLQLGACPCGCIEHSVWVHWLIGDSAVGAVDETVDEAVADASPSPHGVPDHPHDCTGGPRPSYFNNAFTTFHSKPMVCFIETVASHDPPGRDRLRPTCAIEQGKLPHALGPPELQVFQL